MGFPDLLNAELTPRYVMVIEMKRYACAGVSIREKCSPQSKSNNIIVFINCNNKKYMWWDLTNWKGCSDIKLIHCKVFCLCAFTLYGEGLQYKSF
jgi:hypothetical protein